MKILYKVFPTGLKKYQKFIVRLFYKYIYFNEIHQNLRIIIYVGVFINI